MRLRLVLVRLIILVALVPAVVLSADRFPIDVQGSRTYRPLVLGQTGAASVGRHFAAEAAMRMLRRGGNAVDAGVAATFAAAVTEISHFGMGGEVPILVYDATRREVVVVSGQGTAPAAATAERFAAGIPSNGPSAGTVPAVVDALARVLWAHGTLSLAEVLAPAIELADGFPWYEYLTGYMLPHVDAIRRLPSGARVYLTGPGESPPPIGSVFRQPELASTLRALVEEEAAHLHRGRRQAIEAARDRFYAGDISERIADAVASAGGVLTRADLSGYRGRIEASVSRTFVTDRGEFEIHKTGFWGQGPVLLQALALLEGYDLSSMGHNSAQYIHTVTEALKLALADRDHHYGDPEHSQVPAAGLLSGSYAAARRALIEPRASLEQRPGDPLAFDAAGLSLATLDVAAASSLPLGLTASRDSPDTTSVNVVDAAGNLFSAAPSSAWFFGGVFIAGDTGIPLGNRMQAFVLEPAGHANQLAPGKRPRTTLSPTIVLQGGRPFLALSSPGGDTQDQQALQVLLNITVFGMTPQVAIEAPRFNTFHHRRSFGAHEFNPGVVQVESRIPPAVIQELKGRGHKVEVIGPFMMNTGTSMVGIDQKHGTLFGAADPRRQRYAAAW